jgi:hypothetical protein
MEGGKNVEQEQGDAAKTMVEGSGGSTGIYGCRHYLSIAGRIGGCRIRHRSNEK